MTTDLITITITPKDVFVPGGLKPVLAAVDAEIKKFHKNNILDMRKRKDRDILRSFSAQIPRSKTFVDDKRKAYVKDKKAELKIIDQECKSFRDEMDLKKTVTRKPLTNWEDIEKEQIEKERELEIFNMDYDEALGMDDLFNREKAMALKEAEMARVEEEKRQKEEAERLAKEQAERDERLKKEAIEKAELEAKAKIAFEKGEKERVEREAKEAKEKALRDKIAAEERAKIEKEQAIQKAQNDAEEKAFKKEQERLEKERKIETEKQEEKRIADKKAANKKHQATVNNKIIESLMDLDFSMEQSKKIVIAIAQGKIPELKILY